MSALGSGKGVYFSLISPSFPGQLFFIETRPKFIETYIHLGVQRTKNGAPPVVVPTSFYPFFSRVFWRKFSDIKVIRKNTVIVKSLQGVFHFTIMHIGDASETRTITSFSTWRVARSFVRASHGSFKRRDGKVIVENNNIYCHSSAITSLGVK